MAPLLQSGRSSPLTLLLLDLKFYLNSTHFKNSRMSKIVGMLVRQWAQQA